MVAAIFFGGGGGGLTAQVDWLGQAVVICSRLDY